MPQQPFYDLFSFCVGVLASYASWFILFRLIRPALSFSWWISSQKEHTDESTPSYRVRVLNTGRRKVIDLSCTVRLRVKGVGPRPGNWQITELKTSVSHWPILTKDRIIRFYPNETSSFCESRWGEDINEKAVAGVLTLEDILSIGTIAQIRVYVFGFGSFSGARSLFRSNWYEAKDIVPTTFKWIPMRAAIS